MITIDNNRISVDTITLQAIFENGILTSLVRKSDGRILLQAGGANRAPLQLVYSGRECVPLGTELEDRITTLSVSDHRAEVRIESWNGDGVIAVYEDSETGDLVVEPSGYASRPGLRACRWSITGIAPELKLIAPLWQGIHLDLADPIIHDQHFPWPFEWQAGLVILQDDQGEGFWVHCQDAHYRFKALHVGNKEEHDSLYFDTESYGPLDLSLGTGSLAWRINVFDGAWQKPASRYRDWLAATYHPERTPRPDWLADLRFAISWCPCDTDILDALANRLKPSSVLLHIPNWRTDAYDQNYPTFSASSRGQAFIERAQQLGFRVLPHFNSIDMDPTHPAYTYLRDFQYREIESKRLQGWTWADHQVKPLQESNAARLRHQNKNTMVKIHPGLSMWRSILTENVRKAVYCLGLNLAFLDVTLCTWNLHNSLVEGMTPMEGMKMLIAEVASVKDMLVVGGEGRNEITMQDTGLSQVHLFRSSGRSIEGLERTAGYPVNEFLFGHWSRSFGYSALSGHTEDEVMRMRTQVSLGALPTITIHSASEIEHPNAGVEEMLHMAE